jgi:hypothetical protein
MENFLLKTHHSELLNLNSQFSILNFPFKNSILLRVKSNCK